MAWNGKKKCYECDRCGKFIGYFTTQTLCKECNKWLKEYMSRYAEKTVGLRENMNRLKDTDKIKETHVNSDNWDLCKVLDNAPTEEVYTKADMVAMFIELKSKMDSIKECEQQIYGKEEWNFVGKCQDVIQQKINELKTESENNNVQTM